MDMNIVPIQQVCACEEALLVVSMRTLSARTLLPAAEPAQPRLHQAAMARRATAAASLACRVADRAIVLERRFGLLRIAIVVQGRSRPRTRKSNMRTAQERHVLESRR